MLRILRALAFAAVCLSPAAAAARAPVLAPEGGADRLLERNVEIGSGAEPFRLAAMELQSRPAGVERLLEASAEFSAAPVPAATPQAPLIGAVSVAGAEAIGPAALAPSYEPYLGQEAATPTLRALAQAVTDAARRQGYLFASAVIPQQAVRFGVVRLQLDLGQVDEVRIEGSDDRRLRQILDVLVGPAPRRAQVEHQLLLAEDLPGVSISDTRYDRIGGRGVLTVKVEARRAEGQLAVDTFGSDAQGPLRGRVSMAVNGAFLAGDSLSLDVINAVGQSDELSFAQARYTAVAPGGALRAGVAVASGSSRPGEGLEGYDVNGRSDYASVFVSRAVRRTKDASVWVNAEVARLHVKQKFAGVVVQDDEIVTVSAGMSAEGAVGPGRLSGGMTVTQGLPGTNRRGDPLSSRSDTAPDFTKAAAWAVYSQPLGPHASLRFSAAGQAASRPLLAAQEIGLGGPSYGRAYDYSERYGDEGVMASVELRRDLKDRGPAKALQAYVFADGGRVTNIDAGPGDGTLYSAGLGLRGKIGRAEFGAEAAAPLDADRRQSGDRRPRLGAFLRWLF